MVWIRSTYKLPAENREILVKCGDTIGLGHFNQHEGIFILNNGSVFDCREQTVEWMDLMIKEARNEQNEKTTFYS